MLCPPPLQTHMWKEMKDPATAKTFYYNQETGKTQWEVPDELKASASGEDFSAMRRRSVVVVPPSTAHVLPHPFFYQSPVFAVCSALVV